MAQMKRARRVSIENQMKEQKEKEEEFKKELARLMQQKDYSIQEDGSIMTYENPDPAITEEQKKADEWPEWRHPRTFCTKGRKINLKDIYSYSYINENGEKQKADGQWEIKYCPMCGKMLKTIRRKEDFSNDYILEQQRKQHQERMKNV